MEKSSVEEFCNAFANGGALVVGEGITQEFQPFDGEESSEFNINQLKQKHQTSLLDKICKCNWNIVISLSRDANFDEAFRRHYDSLPTSWNVWLSTCPNWEQIPRQHIPVYKLLGSISSPTESLLVTDSPSYLQRRRKWQKILADAKDFILDSPILLIGVNDQPSILTDCLNEMLETLPHAGAGKRIFVLEEEVGISSKTFSSIASNCDLRVVPATQSEAISALEKKSTPKCTHEHTNKPVQNFKNSLFTPVPKTKDLPPPTASRRPILQNYLSMPTLPNWEPFNAEIDWKRSHSNNILTSVYEAFSNPTIKNTIIEIVGDVGTGKTTILKRAAFDLSNNGTLVFWAGTDNFCTTEDIRELIKYASKEKRVSSLNIAIFIDSIESGGLSLTDFTDALSDAQFRWAIIYSKRTIEKLKQNRRCNLKPDTIIEIPTFLGEDELDQIERYISSQSTGITFNSERNSQRIKSKDILFIFWLSLPNSRDPIREGVKQEYFSIEFAENVVKSVTGNVEKRSNNLRDIYQMVAVASHYDLALPMEILVNASTNYSYDEWANLLSESDHPIWSLIYEDRIISKDGKPLSIYRTRNDIITRVVLDVINGSKIATNGEFNILERLIKACDGSSPVYGNFLSRILIERADMLKNLPTEYYGKLWETAKTTYRYWDKGLQHHYGLFIKNNTSDLSKAYEAIKEALDKPDNPTIDRIESAQNIHTSLAATIIASAKNGELQPEEAFLKVEQHINQARQNGFNAHASHVQANNYISLAQSIEGDSVKLLLSIDRALSIIEEASEITRDQDGSAFSSLRQNAIDSLIPIIDETGDTIGKKIFETHKSQIGFVAYGRHALHIANKTKKGSDYKKIQDFINRSIREFKLEEEGISPELKQLRVSLFWDWQYQQKKSSIPWELIFSDAQSLTRDHASTPSIFQYYLAVSAFHLGKIEESIEVFSMISRGKRYNKNISYEIRDVALDSNGNKRTFNGITNTKSTHTFIESQELRTSIRGDDKRFTRIDQTPVSFHVGFSLNGCKAIPVKS